MRVMTQTRGPRRDRAGWRGDRHRVGGSSTRRRGALASLGHLALPVRVEDVGGLDEQLLRVDEQLGVAASKPIANASSGKVVLGWGWKLVWVVSGGV